MSVHVSACCTPTTAYYFYLFINNLLDAKVAKQPKIYGT